MGFYDKTVGGLTLHTSSQLEQCPAAHGFTTRFGGVSSGIYASLDLAVGRGDDPQAVRENYRRVCAALEVDINKLVFSSQVHGDRVRTVTSADFGRGLDKPREYEADALITDVPGAVLAVFTADCCPILLCDPVRRVCAAVHAGWRGTALGIAGKTVERMRDCYGCRPEDLRAGIGPCISMCCFETDEDVPNAMTAALGPAALGFISSDGNGKFHVDLKGLNACILQRAGVDSARIELSPDCTLCKPDKYWSHRYTKGERGSQAALICLR